MSWRAKRNNLGFLKVLLGMKGLTFAFFLDWFSNAHHGNLPLTLPLCRSINKNTKEHKCFKEQRNNCLNCFHNIALKHMYIRLSIPNKPPSRYHVIKFSNSGNAILVFWLVHCILFSSHCTYVWPYMELNAPNVNFSCGKPIFVDKKMDEKKINSVSCLERNKRNYGQSPPSNNKKAIKFGMRIFNSTYPISFP